MQIQAFLRINIYLKINCKILLKLNNLKRSLRVVENVSVAS